MNSLSSLSSFDIGSSTNTLLGSTLPYPANAAGSSPNSLSSSLNASSFASSSSLDSFAASGALGASLSYPFVCPLEFEGLLQSYLLSLHVRKRSKALIEQSMADDCLMVLTNPENTKIFGPKFRWWVRKHFVYTTTTSMVAPEDGSEPQQQQQCILMDRKNGKPVCVKEKLYEKVAHFHEATGHGGRDKTFKAVSFFFLSLGSSPFFTPSQRADRWTLFSPLFPSLLSLVDSSLLLLLLLLLLLPPSGSCHPRCSIGEGRVGLSQKRTTRGRKEPRFPLFSVDFEGARASGRVFSLLVVFACTLVKWLSTPLLGSLSYDPMSPSPATGFSLT